MDKDNEPLLSDMKLSPDDMAARQRQLARKAPVTRTSSARPASAANTPSGPSVGRPSQTMAVAALALAVVLALLSGWLFTQYQAQQQQLQNAEKLLRAQAQSIEVLNERLSVTGENANLSVDALKVILKEHDSEIRKLWELAGKRIRSEIAVNSKAIDDVKTSLAKTDKDIRADLSKQEKQVAANDTAALAREAELKKRLGKVETQVLSIAEAELRLAQQSESIQALEAEIARLKKSGLGSEAADIRLQLEDLSVRIDRLQAAGAVR